MVKILPIEERPPLVCYHHFAFWLSILLGNNKDRLNWVYSTFLNLEWKNSNVLTFYNYESWGLGSTKALNTIYNGYPKTILDTAYYNLIGVFEHLLDNRKYITGTYNEYYIPCKNSYMNFDFDHNYLIYGYNQEKGIFHSIGYTKNMKYEPFVIAYNDFISSQKNVTTNNFSFQIITENTDKQLNFSRLDFINRIKDYLCSQTLNSPSNIVGIKCKDEIIKYFGNIPVKDDNFIDIRICRVLLEHSNNIYNGLLLISANSATDYFPVVNNTAIVHHLAMKYNCTYDPEIIKRIIVCCAEIKLLEETVLTKFLQQPFFRI
jgi:hypothetical protein